MEKKDPTLFKKYLIKNKIFKISQINNLDKKIINFVDKDFNYLNKLKNLNSKTLVNLYIKDDENNLLTSNNKALTEEMSRNKKLVCFGLGVNDSLIFLEQQKDW